ncbi:MAG: tripartite tricarboxylate transporter substrate binding protein [Deltaproteobacteria bacterium]|nr:tripartite tricarboxylate transporter substrate binding protein [Deltaproteobacteria bacterium]MBW2152124.1 tripartite tricarboxylate transporter substrate binding protein [Deltaproteobacteria bacterium]
MNYLKKMFMIMVGVILFIGSSLIPIVVAETEYPVKPIKVIVPFSAGGDTDLTIRIWADFAEKALGQPIVVINKIPPPAGTTFVAKAKPDGYVLSANAPYYLVGPNMAKVEWDIDSFEPVCRITRAVFGLTVNAESPWKTMDEFIEDAKKNPGKYSVGSAGSLNYLTLSTKYWAMQAGIELKYVHHAGSAPAMTSLLGKHVDISMFFPQLWIPRVRDGKLRLLALGAPVKEFPGIPTFDQLGYKGYYFGYNLILAPKGTPTQVIEKLSDVTENVLMKNPKYIQALKNINATPAFLGPKETKELVEDHYKIIAKVTEAMGIRPK